MTIRAVLLDFYGTLAESPAWGPSWAELLAEMGYALPDEVRDRWWNDGIDGVEHDEHSRSRDHYVAWQHQRFHGMLADCGVPTGQAERFIARVREIGAHQQITAFEEVVEVLGALRARDLHLAVCSNWDWDLHEAIEAAGLTRQFDTVVSSAWVGARKPHPRIYEHTLREAGVAPDEALFAGDTWGPDVDGPRAAGMRAIWVRRDHREPSSDDPDPHEAGVPLVTDLHGLLEVIDRLDGRPAGAVSPHA